MITPGSCAVCTRPLPPSSIGGVCVECLKKTGQQETTNDSRLLDPAAIMFRAPARLDLSTRTGSFDPNATTAEPPPAGRLPEAPPGYVLLERLGGGGMGYVYLARERASERLVAMKFLHAPSSPAAFERFLVEVRALASLDHPHIVRVLHVETNWREPFFTMEYAAGGTLADLAKPGMPPVDPAEAARLVRTAAGAVAAAHAAGVIHRDLKPSNILLAGVRGQGSGVSQTGEQLRSLLTPDPCPLTPKVSDFGLAKETDRGEDLTRTGPIGTPGYMSPEAAAGRFREVGVRADVYGLGATLFYLLTGHAPFRGRTKTETVERVIHDAPARVRGQRPDVPAGLEAVVVKALEKDPARRYASAAELAADLGRFLDGQTPAAPELTARRRAARWLGRNRGRLLAAAGLVLVAVGLVAVGQYTAPLPPANADPDDWLRYYQAELRAGRAVVLVPDKGLPAWHEWPVGPAALGPSPLLDGSCSFESVNHALLDLLPNPGARFRLTAEVRVIQAVGGAADRVRSPMAGLYVGRTVVRTADGTQAHAMLTVTFDDYLPAEVKAAGFAAGRARLHGCHVVLRPDRQPETLTAGHGPGVTFDPVERPPGEWRRVRVEAAPDRVRAFWAAGPAADFWLVADLDRNALTTRFQIMHEQLTGWHLEAAPEPAGWTADRPLGVFCQAGQVSVRNVTVEPLP